MSFCDNCGSYMKETAEGLQCPKCGKLIRPQRHVKSKSAKKLNSAIYIVDRPQNSSIKVIRTCPNCGNKQAFHWSSAISGEHAGVRQERTVMHFTCTKCSHSWVESS